MNVINRVLPAGPWRPLLLVSAIAVWPGLLPALEGRGGELLRFAVCGVGLVPLAMALSQVVELLMQRLGPRWGGLLSVVFGNLVEFLVAFNALCSGLYPLVVISLAGAVVINCLPVLGLAIVMATRGRPWVDIDPFRRELQNQQLLISALLLALPSVFLRQPLTNAMQGNDTTDGFGLYSTVVAVLALLIYGLALSRSLFQPQAIREAQGAEPQAMSPSLPVLLAALAAVISGIALISERLVVALEHLVLNAHLNELFVGLFLLPLFGNLPEALVAFKAATRRQIDVVMTSTIESSLQLLLFVLPLLVLCGLPMGRHLHLGLPPVALAALAVAMVMIERITDNHRLNWFEGVQLIVLFLAMALGALLLITP